MALLKLSFLYHADELPFPVSCRWTHVIDSNDYPGPDIGNIPLVLKGDFMETGRAPHPESGIETCFEESWRVVEPKFVEKFPFAFILQSHDGKAFFGQVGSIVQAMKASRAEAGAFTARKQRWDDDSTSWKTNFEIGDGLADLPSVDDVDAARWISSAAVGDQLTVLGSTFIVRGLVSMASPPVVEEQST